MRLFSLASLLGLYLFLLPGSMSCQRQFSDINLGQAGSNPVTIDLSASDRVFFSASVSSAETELFSTDGNTVELLLDPSGPNTSSTLYNGKRIGNAYYSAHRFNRKSQVWRTDLESNESVLLFEDGTSSNNPNSFGQFAEIDGEVYFVARLISQGSHYIYRTDGTAAGTEQVFNAGRNRPLQFQAFRDKLYYSSGNIAFDDPSGETLSVYDPATGTGTLLKDTPESFFDRDNIFGLGPVGDELVFLVNSDGNGLLVGQVDSAADTIRLDTISDSDDYFLLSDLNVGTAVLNDTLYFVYRRADGGDELFKTDGTAAGTSVVANLSTTGDTRIEGLTATEDRLYWYGNTRNGFGALGFEAYVSDGTAAGTSVLKDIAPGGEWNFPNFRRFLAVGNQVYFVARAPGLGEEIWKTDGTEAGTELVIDLAPGELSGGNALLGAVGNQLVFSGRAPDQGFEPYLTDGTVAGTRRLADLNPKGASSNPAGFVRIGEDVYCVATVSDTIGREIVRLGPDGTVKSVINLDTVMGSSGVSLLRAHRGKLFFFGNGSQRGYSRGLIAGFFSYDPVTEVIEDLTRDLTDPALENSFSFIDTIGDFVITDYQSFGGFTTNYLVSDGTRAGSFLLKNGDGDLVRSAQPGISFDGQYYAHGFSNDDYGLYRFDPTGNRDTMELFTVDIRPEFKLFGQTIPTALVYDDVLYFSGTDGINFGRSMFRTDGTTEGTYRYALPGLTGSSQPTNPHNLVLAGGAGDGFYYIGETSQSNQNIYFTRGDTNDITFVTRHLDDFIINDANTTLSGQTVYFLNLDGAPGQELYRIDTSDNGSSLVTDINPGNSSAEIGNLVVVNDTLYFTAFSVTDGRQLYRVTSDSTDAEQIGPIHELENGDAEATALTAIGRDLFFAANNGRDGREIWTYTFRQIPVSTEAAEEQPENFTSAYLAFPQPANDQLTIRAHPGRDNVGNVQLYSITGKRLRAVDAHNSTETVINLNGLPSGAYVLRIRSVTGKVYGGLLMKQ